MGGVGLDLTALKPFTPDSSHLRIFEADPVIEEHRDAVYVPFARDHEESGWGLYDRDGRLIRAAAYRRGPAGALVGQAEAVALRAAEIETAPLGHYVYAGPLITHYGHFLLATLSRLWPRFHGGERFLWFSEAPLSRLAAMPWIGACLTGLGLEAGQFVRFTRPTRIKRVTVVGPAFEEGHFAHQAFRAMCRHIGDALVPAWDARPQAPAYLTRAGLTGGVKTVANEDAVCAALASFGVEIIAPERLGLAEQVALFGSDRVIMGTGGSAFHTSVFAPSRARLIAIELLPNDNQVLLNRLSEARMLHLRRSDEAFPELPAGGPFGAIYRFADPVAVARDLLYLAQAFDQVAGRSGIT